MKKFTISLIITVVIAAVVAVGVVSANNRTFESIGLGERIELSYDDRYVFDSDIDFIKTVFVISDKSDSKKSRIPGGKTLKERLQQSLLLKRKERKVLKKLSSREVAATACGRVKVKLKNGKLFSIRVNPAKISLVMICGQSNAEGVACMKQDLDKYKKQWIMSREGQVYNTYAPSIVTDTRNCYLDVGWYGKVGRTLTVKNASTFIPDSITDNTSKKPWQRTNNLTDADGAVGKSGFDSAFAHEWNRASGEKIWLLNASERASRIDSWDPIDSKHSNNYYQAVALYKRAERVLSNEISAGHYELSKKGIIWLQGETNRQTEAGEYTDFFKRLQTAFMSDLDGSHYKNMGGKIDFTGIIMVRGGNGVNTASEKGEYREQTGPRTAQRQISISNNESYSNVFLASDLGDSWFDDDSVKSWFLNKYGDDDTYKKRNRWKKGEYKLPKTLNEAHGNIHYTQLGYNEIGYDAAKNIVRDLYQN